MRADDRAQIAIFTGALEADASRAYEALQTMERLVGCISFLQRTLKIGYARASLLVEVLEQAGLITSPGEDGARAWTV